MEPETQSQVAEPEQVPPAEETQQTAVAETPAPGAEQGKESPPAEKTFTESELRKREADIRAKSDKDVSEAREALAKINMERQIAALQERERQAAAQDTAAVERGEMSPTQAAALAQKRQEFMQLEFQSSQRRHQDEQSARVTAVQMLVDEVQTEYAETGITFRYTDFLKDPEVKKPDDVRVKALKMVNKKLSDDLRSAKSKAESYYNGPSKSGSADVFTGTVTEAQIEDDDYWTKHREKILEYERSGRLVVKK